MKPSKYVVFSKSGVVEMQQRVNELEAEGYELVGPVQVGTVQRVGGNAIAIFVATMILV